MRARIVRPGRFRRATSLLLVAATATLGLTSLPASATSPSNALSGSAFESGDGNLAATSGTTPTALDWNSGAPNVVRDKDEFTGSKDDAFGQGAKEDIANPTQVTGSIPPNKSDLTYFYSAHDKGTNGDQFLYMAWERSNVLGNANMDFEFNQSKTLVKGTPTRTSGDMLVTFDFTNGGSKPAIGILRWATASGQYGACFSANSFPCWAGTDSDINGTTYANGAVYTNTGATIHDDYANVDLPALTFGEAGIDLNAAGVFGSECLSFGQAFLKSRSSSSFTSEIKDFIKPQQVSVTNCGSVVASKVDDAGNPLTSGVTLALYTDNAPTGTAPGAEDTLATLNGTAKTSGTVDDQATTTTVTVADASKLPAATDTYFLQFGDASGEVVKVTSRTTTTLTVVRGQNGTAPAAHASNVTLTQVQVCNPGDIDVTTGTAPNTTTTTYHAFCQFSNVHFGTYWVVETTHPTGYTIGDPQQVVVADGGNTPAATFANPLTFVNNRAPVNITVTKKDDAGGKVPICTATITTGCASFQLFLEKDTTTTSSTFSHYSTTSTTGTLDSNGINATTLSIGLATGSFSGTNFYVLIDDEIIKVASVSGSTLTVATGGRGAEGTVAAAHDPGKAVTKITLTDVYVASCVGQASPNTNVCKFNSITPEATYWIVETTMPTGYTADSTLPKKITIPLGASDSDEQYTFTNTRLFKVITFVCNQADGSLYASTVTLNKTTTASDGSDSATSASALATATGVDASKVCALTAATGGAVFPNRTANGSGDTTSTLGGTVLIPHAQP